MEWNRVLPVIVLSILALSYVPSFVKAFTSVHPTRVFVSPVELEVKCGQSFQVYINVSDATELQAFDFMLRYNSRVLSCVSVEEGSFLSSGGATFVAKKEINNEYGVGVGRVWLSVALLGTANVNGSGVLGAITFNATAGGGSVLDLYSDFPYNPDLVTLSTGVLTSICHVVVDGHVVVVCPPVECKVTFLTSPGCPGFNITFCGTTYQNGSVGTFAYGTSGYAVVNHGAGYVLDHWEVSGNVQVSSKWISPTYVTVTCGGTLKVVCRSLAPGYDCPVANFTFKKNGPRVNFNASASFDSVPTRAIASYRWDFGDGTTAAVSDFTIVHYYAKAGTYKVNLTVVNDLDESNSAEQNLTIRIPACAWKRL